MTDDPAAVPKNTDKKKQVVAGIITVITLVLVFGIVFPQFADYGEAWDAVQQMSALALTVLLLMALFNVIVYVWPYQASLPGLSYGPGFVVRQTSFMISNVIPAGGAFGLAIQYAMLGSYGFGAAETTAAIGITSTFNTFVTLSLPVLGAVGLIAIGEGTQLAYVLAAIGLAIVVAIIVVLAMVFRSESSARRLGGFGDRVVAWLFGILKKEPGFGVTDWVVDFRNSTVDVIRQGWLKITATNYFQQIMQFLILWAAVYAIQGGTSAPVSFVEAFVAYAFGRLASFVPVTPGGLGTVDAAMTGILVAFGAASSDALAAVMVWRALSYFPQVFLGIGAFLYWRRREAKAA
ncbi:MAG: YbhN family protein [Actinomycetota bacterium]